jgi:hypothetical protein
MPYVAILLCWTWCHRDDSFFLISFMPLELVDDVTTRVIDQDTGMHQAIYVRFSSTNEVICISATLVIHAPRYSDLCVI